MKKVLSVMLVVFLSVVAYGQKDVTKFLGIPVDGSKQAMIQKLKAKGYAYNATYDCLTGEFNGKKVTISIQTNNNKVWRIIVSDVNGIDETNIKIRFNELCRQFDRNTKYSRAALDGYFIPDDENIQHEILINKKRYQASFFQRIGTENDDPSNRLVWFMINELYGDYRIAMFYENGYNEANGEDL
ncbi:MAG: hypothetical protein J6B91_02660 [Prevotella sp.]|nr:hypothetical protein [Prevotella sp.]